MIGTGVEKPLTVVSNFTVLLSLPLIVIAVNHLLSSPDVIRFGGGRVRAREREWDADASFSFSFAHLGFFSVFRKYAKIIRQF